MSSTTLPVLPMPRPGDAFVIPSDRGPVAFCIVESVNVARNCCLARAQNGWVGEVYLPVVAVEVENLRRMEAQS